MAVSSWAVSGLSACAGSFFAPDIRDFRYAFAALAGVKDFAIFLPRTAGGPCPVVITLERSQDGGIAMHIADRGRGLAGAPDPAGGFPGHHVGLEGMRERMTALGGRLELASVPGSGTRVSAYLPRGVAA